METRAQLYHRCMRARSSARHQRPSASTDRSLPLHHGPTALANIDLQTGTEGKTLNLIVLIQGGSDDLLIQQEWRMMIGGKCVLRM